MSQYFDFIDSGLLDQKLGTGTFPFSKYLFWHTPVEMTDTRLHQKYIIERVLAKGFLSDLYMLLKMYSRDEIVAVVKKSRVFDRKTISFCSCHFNVPINELHASSYYN